MRVALSQVKTITAKASLFFHGGSLFLQKPSNSLANHRLPLLLAHLHPPLPPPLHSFSLSAPISLPSVMLREEFYSCCQLTVHTRAHTHMHERAGFTLTLTHNDTHVGKPPKSTRRHADTWAASMAALELIKRAHGGKATWREAVAGQKKKLPEPHCVL